MDISLEGISIGPLEIRFYSLMILAGLLAGILLAQREAKRLRENPEHVVNIAVLGALFGLIGARLYHVLDRNEWPYYRQNPEQIFAIWNGGIGIFGAIAGAALALVVYVWWVNRQAAKKRRPRERMSVLRWFDIGAPAFLLGQAIGRWGNFFNQELFGTPTDLPWGIAVDAVNRPPQFADATHFHPLFLYESLLSFLGVIVLLFVARRFSHWVRPGDILLLYLIWYPAERSALEFLRFDNWVVGPVPMAHIVSGILIVIAGGIFIWRHSKPAPPPDTRSTEEQQRRSRAAQRRERRRRAETESHG